MKFSELNLHPQTMAGLEALKFAECTPIQEAALPVVLEGQDLAGLAQTGTGKTAAFLVPLIDRIMRSREAASLGGVDQLPETLRKRCFKEWKEANYVLVLVPTRELADQVYQNVKQLNQVTGLKGVAIYGGTSYDRQKSAVSGGVQFVIATPGRLIDLYKEHIVDLRQVRAVVFDEADRMFDMGFKDDMKYILKRIPRERQFLVFSATLNFDVLNTAYEFGADPFEVNISKDQPKAENVEDEIFHIGDKEKPAYLLSLLKKHKPTQCIIFSNFKMQVERLAGFLNKNGVPAVGISSLLNQGQRNRVMAQFKSDNNQNILVATDVAARGLDILGVDMVVNYELPDDPENYVHRIGRTGRAGQKGIAKSLVSDRDVEALARIQEYLEYKINIGWLEDDEIIKEYEVVSERKDQRQSRGMNKSRSTRKTGSRPNRGRKPGDKENKRREGQKASESTSERPNRKRSGQRRRRGDGSQKAEGGGRSTHRDRLSGRHGQKQSGEDQQKAGSSKKRTRRSSSSSKRRRSTRTSKGSRSNRPASSPSVAQKVGGFLKKLFGGDSDKSRSSNRNG